VSETSEEDLGGERLLMPDSAGATVRLVGLLEQLATEPQAARRRCLLTDYRPSWHPELVLKLYDEMLRRAHSDLRQAERLARAAAWLSECLGDEPSRAVGLRALGHISFLRRTYPSAWERYQAALVIYQRLGMELELGRTLIGALATLMYLGRHGEALQAAQKARSIFSEQNDRLRLARVDIKTANILNRQGRFEEALELYQRAYVAFIEIGEPGDVAITLRNLATCQINLNEFASALETYPRSVSSSARRLNSYRSMKLS
jgi:tetratricopeptide (TPR) repeat protein